MVPKASQRVIGRHLKDVRMETAYRCIRSQFQEYRTAKKKRQPSQEALAIGNNGSNPMGLSTGGTSVLPVCVFQKVL